jgi:hypothetical protein
MPGPDYQKTPNVCPIALAQLQLYDVYLKERAAEEGSQ